MEITKVKDLIKHAAASKSAVSEDNGTTALQNQTSFEEPVIPLTNAQPTESTILETGTAPTAQSKRRETALAYIKSHFVEGRHYMRIKGVAKPVLTKIGAYSLLNAMQLREAIDIVNITIVAEASFVSYTVRCRLITQDGEIIAEALGAANTQETKFAKNGLSAQHLVATQSAKRALCNAIKNTIY